METTQSRPAELSQSQQAAEVLRCAESPAYFIDSYCRIYDAGSKDWIPFALWPAQYRTLKTIDANKLSIVLKARQLGLTWLVLGYALWLMTFRAAATVLLFSKRDEEAVELASFRLTGMYARLPPWLRPRVARASAHDLELANGSRALAFPTTGGRSYTATLVVVDEADFVPDLQSLLNAVKPTIDAGGQMILLSTVDKAKPASPFKDLYRASKKGETAWRPIFLPWSAAPWRTVPWYEQYKAEKLATTGTTDDLWQEYPATDSEALAPKVLDKRIPPAWLERCYAEMSPTVRVGVEADQAAAGVPSVPGLEIYRMPEEDHEYVIGADPAEGNPTSDDSALEVLDAGSGEQVASLAGKLQPSTLADYADKIGRYYHRAGILVERNNHGHAVILWLEEFGRCTVLAGFDGRAGWHTTPRGKALLYDRAADAFRDQDTTLHGFGTLEQLQSIEGSTLNAPEGLHDDRAMAYVLALQARAEQAGSTPEVIDNPFL